MFSYIAFSFYRIIRLSCLALFLTACAPTSAQTTQALTATQKSISTESIVVTIPASEPLLLSTATQIPRVTSIPVTLLPTPSHSLLLKGQTANSITLDSDYIYWTTDQDPYHIFRYPLTGGETEIIATTQFSDGSLSTLLSIRSGEWLIFLDTQSSYITWKVRALNLKDGTEQVVVAEAGDPASWPGPFVSADGDWVAWTRTGHSASENCDQTILAMRNLKTGEQRELERLCTTQNYMWTFPSLSGDKLVVEQDLPDDKGRGNNIYLFDLTSGQRTALTNNGSGSAPTISGKWVVWKDTPRFDNDTNDIIYNLQDSTQQSMSTPSMPPYHLMADHWLYWPPSPLKPFYIYDLMTEQLLKVTSPGKNENIDAVAVSSTIAAWARDLDFDKAPPKDTMLEWRTIP